MNIKCEIKINITPPEYANFSVTEDDIKEIVLKKARDYFHSSDIEFNNIISIEM